MSIKESIQESRQRKLVDDHKFDEHMERARLQDIAAREKIFAVQTGDNVERRDGRKKAKGI